jgi:hypothetical protein
VKIISAVVLYALVVKVVSYFIDVKIGQQIEELHRVIIFALVGKRFYLFLSTRTV